MFVCRVGERPRQDIETQSRFGHSVANTIWKSLPRIPCEKRKETPRKRGTKPVFTICDSDLAWLLQCFVFKVRNDKVISEGSSFFSNSLSLSLGFPTCRHACNDLDFYRPSIQLSTNLSFATQSLSLEMFLKESTTSKKQIHTRAKRKRGRLYTETKKKTFLFRPTSNRCICFASYIIENQPLVQCGAASRAPMTSLVLVTHTIFGVGFTRWHSADRKLQVANRRSISNLYPTQVWYLKIPDLGEAEVWYLVVNEWLKAGPPPLDLSFWSFLTFLHHGIEEVERHLLWKFYKKIRRKSWSNVPPKLVACIGFLYKVVHKIGRLRKFNRSREIEFNFLTAWTISMKFGTLVQHAPGYKTLPQIF